MAITRSALLACSWISNEKYGIKNSRKGQLEKWEWHVNKNNIVVAFVG